MPVVTLSKSNVKTYDTMFNSGQPTTSQATLANIYVGVSSIGSAKYRSAFFFDLGLIPNDAMINSATFNITTPSGGGGSAARVIDVHAITSSWLDTNTWNTQPSFEPTPTTSLSVGTAAATYSFDVKNLIQAMVNGQSNFGFLLKAPDETITGTEKFFYSFEGSTNQPTLTIDYTIPTTGKKQVEFIDYNRRMSGNPSASLSVPTGAQVGDLLIAQINVEGIPTVISPTGWTTVETFNQNGSLHILAYRFMSAGDASFSWVFQSGGSYNWIATCYSFRNVKQVVLAGKRSDGGNTTSISPQAILTGDVTTDLGLLLNFFWMNNKNSVVTWTPPKNFGVLQQYSPYSFQSQMADFSYMYSKRTYNTSEMAATTTLAGWQVAMAMVLVPKTNNSPTLTLAQPGHNQTLTEQATLSISGSSVDQDNGNVLTVKYKINNGTARALQSGVSDGITPLSFARDLKYSSKRMYDGAVDVSGADLAENTDHTLTVWAEDDKGGKSAEVTRKFRVVWNRPPTISDSNRDLGTLTERPTVTYSAVDPEGNSFTFTEYVNGQQIRSFAGAGGQQNTFELTHDAWIKLDLDVQHQLKIVATDSAGISSERVYTFTRTETHLEFMLDYNNPDVAAFFTVDGMPERILFTLERYLPPDSEIESVLVTNNYLDASPTWEDARNAVIGGRGYIFTNKTKTAADWAICVWVTLAKGSATQRVHVYGYGGAFD